MDETERKALARAAGGARPIGAYAARALDPSARARGFATTALLREWPAIVGAELAEFTMPDRLVWPRRREDAEEPSSQKGWRTEGAILVLKSRALAPSRCSIARVRSSSDLIPISATGRSLRCVSCRLPSPAKCHAFPLIPHLSRQTHCRRPRLLRTRACARPSRGSAPLRGRGSQEVEQRASLSLLPEARSPA